MKKEIRNSRDAVLYFKNRFAGFCGTMSAKIWWQKHKWATALWFAKRTIQAMRGKIGIIGGREVYSKGGFRYYQCEISEMPFNKDADYTNF